MRKLSTLRKNTLWEIYFGPPPPQFVRPPNRPIFFGSSEMHVAPWILSVGIRGGTWVGTRGGTSGGTSGGPQEPCDTPVTPLQVDGWIVLEPYRANNTLVI